jgi:tetratricopeptide (TPR) repeat protein
VALDAVHRLGDLSGEARTRGGLARAYRQLGSHEQAMTHLRELSILFQWLGDNNGQSRAHRSIAQILEDQHCYQEALDHAEQSLQLATDPAERASALNAVGWYHTQLGNYSQGLDYCEQSRDLHRDNGDYHSQAAVCDSLGVIHHQSGNYPAAISSFLQALNLFETAGERYKMADTLIRLSETHYAANDTHLACNALRRAESILSDLGHPRIREVQARLHGLDAE